RHTNSLNLRRGSFRGHDIVHGLSVLGGFGLYANVRFEDVFYSTRVNTRSHNARTLLVFGLSLEGLACTLWFELCTSLSPLAFEFLVVRSITLDVLFQVFHEVVFEVLLIIISLGTHLK